MNFEELDKLLREQDDEEKFLRLGTAQLNSMQLESRVKSVYSLDKDQGEWVINSSKLMKAKENFAIHKHKRFVKFKEHRHDYIELLYVYSGEIRQKISGKEITIKEGEVCLFDLNITHSIEPASENDIAINIIMTKEFFDSIFLSFISDNDIISDFIIKALYNKKEYKQYLLFNCDKNEFIQTILKKILCEYYDRKIGYDTAIHAFILILFTELLRDYKKNMDKSSQKDLNNTVINEVKAYLCKNYKEATLKSTAEYFHFHPDYLSKVIKNYTGESFIALLQNIRLKEACMLLEKTNTSVDEIVDRVGYSNLSFFYKLFKKKYNLTPIEYRNQKN
jgi:AraC family cel operon transcriptional repressor